MWEKEPSQFHLDNSFDMIMGIQGLLILRFLKFFQLEVYSSHVFVMFETENDKWFNPFGKEPDVVKLGGKN